MGTDRRPEAAFVTTRELEGDPFPILARARDLSPVAWVPDLESWLVTGRAQCIDALADSQAFTVDDERFSTGRVVGPSMLSLDGDPHRRHRRAFTPPFRSSAVRKRLGPWVRDRVEGLIEEMRDRRRGDLRAMIATPIASLVMQHALGLGEVPVGDVIRWNDEIVAAIDGVTRGGEIAEQGRAAHGELSEALASAMSSSGPLAGLGHDEGLSALEIASNVAVLLIGGVVTTDGTIAIAMRHLLDNPRALRELGADSALLPAVVDESMRLEPAAAFVDRYAKRDIRLGEAWIRGGDLVRISLSAANRDPSWYDEPDRFDPRRDHVDDHITFARGPHACLGIHLARLVTTEAVAAMNEGLPRLRAAPGESDRPSGLIFRAPRTVPAVWG